MHIVGTAGHVDHGKSSLVQALTGVNPDRWAEEQARGMTLDLGFARLSFDDGIEAGIVDVPGHERFLHNMLAGAAGMELLLLAIAANEGVMPQTIEHLQILSFLNVRRTIVVMTKSDLIDPERQASRIDAIRGGLRGTIAADAPFVAVSSRTHAGLDVLRDRIHDELAALPPRAPDAPAYLPIDRAFTLAGRGTIVTGTLMQGRIAVGDSLALEPSGGRVRVRSLQVFGEARDFALGGSRIAVNVPGIERSAIARGDVIADAQFGARSHFKVRFEPLADALPLLRKRTPVRAHIGSAEIIGTLHLPCSPSDTGILDADLHLRQPVAAFPGVRFVLRRMSPKTLLGGGEIEAVSSETDSSGSRSATHQRVAAVLQETQLEPLSAAEVAFKANLREEVAQSALDEMAGNGDALRIARPTAYLDGERVRELLSRICNRLQTMHDAEPWAMGTTSILLGRELVLPEPLLVRLLTAFVEDGRVVQRYGYYALPSHKPHLSAEQRAFFDEIVRLDATQPHVPTPFDDAVADIKRSRIAGVQKAFDALLAGGSLVKVGDALYRGSQIGTIHTKLADFIERNDRMTMAEFRDLLGTSRKYAVPLLEWFDSRGITVRSGDFRSLREKKKPAG